MGKTGAVYLKDTSIDKFQNLQNSRERKIKIKAIT